MMMMPSSSFYVTLTSGANKNEFPDNQAQRFKNRLFHSLILREPGWRVGLSSLSLPMAKPDLRALIDSFEGRWVMLFSTWPKTASGILSMVSVTMEAKLYNTRGYVRTGVDFMKTFVDGFKQAIYDGVQKGYTLASTKQHTYYLDLRWEGEDLVIDNSNVFRELLQGRPIIKIKKKLGLQMKWFVLDSQNRIKLGPNLVMSLPDTIPEVLDTIDTVNHQTIYLKEQTSERDGDFVQLSVFANWRFVNLNEAFRSNWQVDDRLIYVNSDAVSSSIVGMQMEDLLRVVPYISSDGRGTFHFEPNHVHYKALRKAFFEVIETQVSERDGKLVDFGNGECEVTLHFKRDFLAAT